MCSTGGVGCGTQSSELWRCSGGCNIELRGHGYDLGQYSWHCSVGLLMPPADLKVGRLALCLHRCRLHMIDLMTDMQSWVVIAVAVVVGTGSGSRSDSRRGGGGGGDGDGGGKTATKQQQQL